MPNDEKWRKRWQAMRMLWGYDEGRNEYEVLSRT